MADKRDKTDIPTWAVIRSYFRDIDVKCMIDQGIDLSDCAVVRTNAEDIYGQLSGGQMPPDKPWPQNQIDDFHTWWKQGTCP